VGVLEGHTIYAMEVYLEDNQDLLVHPILRSSLPSPPSPAAQAGYHSYFAVDPSRLS
jgi:hypothetical protein